MTSIQLTHADLLRFWAKVQVDGMTRCWEWEGNHTSDKGNGEVLPQFHLRDRKTGFNIKVGARRLSYLIHFGVLPKTVGCTCSNRNCVNPQHLTPALSRRHAVAKTFESSRDGHHKLEPKLVRQCVTLRKLGRTQAAIARKTGLSQAQVCLILRLAGMCERGELGSSARKTKRGVS